MLIFSPPELQIRKDGEYNDDDVDYTPNNLTEPFWTEKAEAQGAVFLPAAGIRDFYYVGMAGKYGLYWSSSCLNPNWASTLATASSIIPSPLTNVAVVV